MEVGILNLETMQVVRFQGHEIGAAGLQAPLQASGRRGSGFGESGSGA